MLFCFSNSLLVSFFAILTQIDLSSFVFSYYINNFLVEKKCDASLNNKLSVSNFYLLCQRNSYLNAASRIGDRERITDLGDIPVLLKIEFQTNPIV